MFLFSFHLVRVTGEGNDGSISDDGDGSDGDGGDGDNRSGLSVHC